MFVVCGLRRKRKEINAKFFFRFLRQNVRLCFRGTYRVPTVQCTVLLFSILSIDSGENLSMVQSAALVE